MIIIRFGQWSYSGGKLFWYQRLYWKGYKWTPFVKVGWRYKTKSLFEVHICLNGMVLVFDCDGEQIPKFQGQWKKKRMKIFKHSAPWTIFVDHRYSHVAP